MAHPGEDHGAAAAAISSRDVDGFVAIGALPLVFELNGSLDLKPRRFQCASPTEVLRSCKEEVRAKFKGCSIIKAGYAGGYTFGLLTNLSLEQVRQLLIQFVSESCPRLAGIENLGLAYGNLAHHLGNNGSSLLHLSPSLLHSFSEFVLDRSRSHLTADSLLLKGILYGFGMKADIGRFMGSVPSLLDENQVEFSDFHLAFEIKAETAHVFLKSNVKDKFGCRGAKFFMPLGNIHASCGIFTEQSSLVHLFNQKTDLSCERIRIYNPELSHSRPPNLKDHSRAAVATGVLLGMTNLKSGLQEGHGLEGLPPRHLQVLTRRLVDPAK